MAQDIQSLIPHRKPFLFVDDIEVANAEEIIGYKVFGDDEFFFQGHFPEYPVVPGVILIECMAQCGGAGANMAGLYDGAISFLVSVDKAKFRRQVRPGERVKIVIANRRCTPQAVRQSGKVYVGDEVAAEAEWLCLRGTDQ